MARTIYIYPGTTAMMLLMPNDTQPLTVQLDHEDPQLWIVLDPQAPFPRDIPITKGHTWKIEEGSPIKW